ncbi:hypothetical protein Q1695_012225 [Nippostrongylus brasiliensis]|nr:hypothetical protein Q1695_012225 [Nippostrongylus brasiliensis]
MVEVRKNSDEEANENDSTPLCRSHTAPDQQRGPRRALINDLLANFTFFVSQSTICTAHVGWCGADASARNEFVVEKNIEEGHEGHTLASVVVDEYKKSPSRLPTQRLLNGPLFPAAGAFR